MAQVRSYTAFAVVYTLKRSIIKTSIQRKLIILSPNLGACSQAIENGANRFFLISSAQLTNRRQFSMVYTLIDHKMTS